MFHRHGLLFRRLFYVLNTIFDYSLKTNTKVTPAGLVVAVVGYSVTVTPATICIIGDNTFKPMIAYLTERQQAEQSNLTGLEDHKVQKDCVLCICPQCNNNNAVVVVLAINSIDISINNNLLCINESDFENIYSITERNVTKSMN